MQKVVVNVLKTWDVRVDWGSESFSKSSHRSKRCNVVVFAGVPK